MGMSNQNQTKTAASTANKIAATLADPGAYKSAVGFTPKDKHTANRRIWIAKTIEKITQFIRKHFREEQKSEEAIYAAIALEKEKNNRPDDTIIEQRPDQDSTASHENVLNKLWEQLLKECSQIGITIQSTAKAKVKSLTQSISTTSKVLQTLGLGDEQIEKIVTALKSNVLLGDSIEDKEIKSCLESASATVGNDTIQNIKEKIKEYIIMKNELSQANSLTDISAEQLAQFTLSSSLLSKPVTSLPSLTPMPPTSLSESEKKEARKELLNNCFPDLSKATANFVLTQSSTPTETCALAKALSASDINTSFLRLEKNDKSVNLNPDNDLSHYNTLRIVQASYEQKSTADEFGESIKGAFEHVTSKVTGLLSKSTQFIRNALGMEKPAISSPKPETKNILDSMRLKATLLGELTRQKKKQGKDETSNMRPSWVRTNRPSTKVEVTSETTKSKTTKPRSPKM